MPSGVPNKREHDCVSGHAFRRAEQTRKQETGFSRCLMTILAHAEFGIGLNRDATTAALLEKALK
jgi:hypothetical protein